MEPSFNYACFYDKQFCEFALRVVENVDGYNSTVLIGYQNGQEEFFDISQNLCASFAPDGDGGFEREGSTPNPGDSYWGMKARSDVNYSTAIPYISAAFPMEYMAGYLVHHGQANLEFGNQQPAPDFYRSCAKATGMLTYALVVSVILYVGLTFGDARERHDSGDNSVLATFLNWFNTTIISCYVAVWFGWVHFFFALDDSVRIVSSYFAKGALARQQTYAIIVFSAVCAPTLAYVAYGISKVYAMQRTIHPEPSAQPTAEESGQRSANEDTADNGPIEGDHPPEPKRLPQGEENSSEQLPDQLDRGRSKVSIVLTIIVASFLSWPWQW